MAFIINKNKNVFENVDFLLLLVSFLMGNFCKAAYILERVKLAYFFPFFLSFMHSLVAKTQLSYWTKTREFWLAEKVLEMIPRFCATISAIGCTSSSILSHFWKSGKKAREFWLVENNSEMISKFCATLFAISCTSSSILSHLSKSSKKKSKTWRRYTFKTRSGFWKCCD